jgi:hypothetical protein
MLTCYMLTKLLEQKSACFVSCVKKNIFCAKKVYFLKYFFVFFTQGTKFIRFM